MTLREILGTLRAANEAYRNGTATMSDADYDEMQDQLAAKAVVGDPSDPDVAAALAFLASIGAPVQVDSGWIKVRHGAPMGSLNKAQSVADLETWHASCGSGHLIVSEKLDGISVSLSYVDGRLARALTRGDGDVGEDITRNVVRMKGIVHEIRGFTGHLRGEIVLRRSDHVAHFPTYSNPRNAAAGIAKRLDGVGSEHLTVMHYQMLRDQGSGLPLTRKVMEFKLLERVGCAVPAWSEHADLASVVREYEAYVASKREAIDYDIDGLVVEYDDLALVESLGDLNRRPKAAVAFKFPHARKTTTLRAVRWQVGKSGRITPVAEFDTVDLAGAKVSNASLHNVANVDRLAMAAGQTCLFVGNRVIASRRNDVIPFVEEVLPGFSPASAVAIQVPDSCPACATPLLMEGEYLVCRGEDCPAQVLGAISRWVKKIGVLGIGDSIIAALIEHAGVEDAADLYTLDPDAITDVPTGTDGSRLGRTAQVIVDELREKAAMPLHTFVGSLGIPMCARSVCKTVADAGFDTLDKMRAASVAEITAIPGMGPAKAEAFVTGIRNRERLIGKLLGNGVVIQAKAVGGMTGKSVCMTGFRSPEMEKAIEDAGGTVKSGVGAGLTYLVAKDPGSTSGKAQKAKTLGITVVGIDEMWALLGGKQATQPKAAPVPVVVPESRDGVFDLFGD